MGDSVTEMSTNGSFLSHTTHTEPPPIFVSKYFSSSVSCLTKGDKRSLQSSSGSQERHLFFPPSVCVGGWVTCGAGAAGGRGSLLLRCTALRLRIKERAFRSGKGRNPGDRPLPVTPGPLAGDGTTVRAAGHATRR